MQKGSVYVLVNPRQPGTVKIGKTTKDPQARAAELSSASGVLGKFEVFSSTRCEDIDHVEYLVHQALRNCRAQRNREFFHIAPENAAATIRSCASLIENAQSGQAKMADPDELDRGTGADTEASEKAPAEVEPVAYSYKLMGNRTSSIGESIPYNFHTRRISTSCTRCAAIFSQTLSRGEKVVRCPNCLSPQSHEAQW
jgi:hypothetical protein